MVVVGIFPRGSDVHLAPSPPCRCAFLLRGGPGAHAYPVLALFHEISRSVRNCRCLKSHGVTTLLSCQHHLPTCRES